MIVWWLEKKNRERKNKMRQGEGTSRNWQGRKRDVVSTARGHERQHETDFLERVGEADCPHLLLHLGPGENRVRSEDLLRGHKLLPFCETRSFSDVLNVLCLP